MSLRTSVLDEASQLEEAHAPTLGTYDKRHRLLTDLAPRGHRLGVFLHEGDRTGSAYHTAAGAEPSCVPPLNPRVWDGDNWLKKWIRVISLSLIINRARKK